MMSPTVLGWLRRGKKSKKQPENPCKKRKSFKPDFEMLELRNPAAETIGVAISHFALASSALGVLDLLGRHQTEQTHSRQPAITESGVLPYSVLTPKPALNDGPKREEQTPVNGASSHAVTAPTQADPLSASVAFSSANSFASFPEDPFALFLGPAPPHPIAAGSPGLSDSSHDAGGRSGGGGGGAGGAGTGASPPIGGLPTDNASTAGTFPFLSPTAPAANNPAPSAPANSNGQQGGQSDGQDQGDTPKHPKDPLYIWDANKAIAVTPGVTENEFSNWSMDLRAQVTSATVSSYSWSVANAADATNVTGASTYRLQFTWANFTGAARTDTITVTETPTVGQPNTQSITFKVASTSSPAYTATAPTSSSTWPSVITPDAVMPDQETAGGGQFNPTACT
jgi:hypothetical protein